MSNQLIEGEDFYYENNLVVLTEKYHLKKRLCCGNGCRHCPYNFKNVPEPKRSEMLIHKGFETILISSNKK